MKGLKLLLLLGLVTCFSACGDDDSEPSCSYASQNMEGQIEGVEWTFDVGSADFFGSGDDETMSIDMYGVIAQVTDGCSGNSDFSRIFFSMPKELGTRELYFELFGDPDPNKEQQTVTFYDPDTQINVIVSDGCIEITNITDAVVEGKMNINSGSDNFMNGNFSLEVCN